MNIYANELVFWEELMNDEFQKTIQNVFINFKQNKQPFIIRKGPVKTVQRITVKGCTYIYIWLLFFMHPQRPASSQYNFFRTT